MESGASENLQVEGKLAVVEQEEAFLVVRDDDHADWLVRFEKSNGFPAREWAENMAAIYNRRLFQDSSGPPTPPGERPTSYHPGS